VYLREKEGDSYRERERAEGEREGQGNRRKRRGAHQGRRKCDGEMERQR